MHAAGRTKSVVGFSRGLSLGGVEESQCSATRWLAGHPKP